MDAWPYKVLSASQQEQRFERTHKVYQVQCSQFRRLEFLGHVAPSLEIVHPRRELWRVVLKARP